jgi:hypothetical protein
VDYNQQIEAMRLNTPEQLSAERFHRVVTAVDIGVRSIDASEVIAPTEIGRAAAGAAVIADAEAIVAAEYNRIVALEGQRAQASTLASESINTDEAQARADVMAAHEGNPLFTEV